MAIPDPPRTCDPGPGNYWTTVLEKFNARVRFAVRWSWDGVSTWPDCTGPVVDVTLTNISPHAWQAQFPLGRAAKTRTIAAGASRVFTGTQLATIGLVTVDDVLGVRMIDLAVPS